MVPIRLILGGFQKFYCKKKHKDKLGVLLRDGP